MNKKEIAEIRKQFTPERCTITRMCSCYVDAEKNKKMSTAKTFLSLPEEEVFKYLDIFKKSLSGTLGKNLVNLDFPMEAEEEGGTQAMLMALRQCGLEDEELVNAYFDKVIENYSYAENYLVTLIYAAYDYPTKGTDETTLEDSSDNVFTHLLCSICPVKLSKAGLSYDPDKNDVADRVRDWVVDRPMHAFLFPLFNDRATDIHGVLYYTKNAEDIQVQMITELLGCGVPTTPEVQKDAFIQLVECTLGEECTYDTVMAIQENLAEIMEVEKDSPDMGVLTKNRVKQIFQECGVSEETMENFDEEFDAATGGDPSLVLSNIAAAKKTSIKMPDVVVTVDPAKLSTIETREIEGRKFLVIPVDTEVEINGITLAKA